MLKLRLTGPPALLLDGKAAALERKDAALLAVLAIDGTATREALAALLWPDVPAKTAHTSLRQRVFRLRKRAGCDVVVTGPRLRLAEGVEHDAAMSAARAVDALAIPAGDLLGGLAYGDCDALSDWVRAARERWRAWRRDALIGAAARHEAAGELARAIDLTLRVTAEEPLNEHAQRRLVALHYLRGDRAAAIAAFESFERALKDELGVRPAAETLELFATVVEARPLVPARRAVVPAALRRPPRLIGRDAELALLDAAWAAGRVFLVLGEAGMGKSRLLAEFATMQPMVVVAQARPGDAGVPFALLARLLRAVRETVAAGGAALLPPDESTRRELARVLPEVAAGLTIAGDAQPALLQRAIETMLVNAHAHGVGAMVADDLQFADDASLDLLQSLVTAERLAPLHWGLAQRPGEGGDAARALALALEETQRLQRVPLAPLDRAAMVSLIASLNLPEIDATRLAGPLVRHTGGNPLFALETLKDMVVGGGVDGDGAGARTKLPQPATVGVLIERRLARLSAPALALARVAAIAGSDFSIDLAEHVLRTPALGLADAWRELESAQVLQGAAFAHDLVHDAALRTVPDEIARHVHAAVATRLQEQGGEPARIAGHWRAALRWADAARQFEAAAVRARQGARLVEARTLWDAAIDAHRAAGDDAGRFRAELKRVDVLLFTDGIDAARRTVQALGEEARSDEERVLAQVLIGQVHVIAGEWQIGLQAATGAVALAQRAGAPELAIESERQIGIAMSRLGRAAEAVDRLRASLPLVQRVGSTSQHYQHLGALAYALNAADRPADSIDTLNRVCELAAAEGDLAEVMASTANLANARLSIGHVGEAYDLAHRARMLAERLGDPAGLQPLVNRMNLGLIAAQRGRYGEALDTLGQALEALKRVGSVMWQATAENYLASVWIDLGQPAQAARLLATAAADGIPATRLRRLALRAGLARLLGQRPEVAALASLLDGEGAALTLRIRLSARTEVARAAVAGEALPALRAVAAEASAHGFEGLALHARLREIERLTEADADRAAALADAALEAATRCVPSDAYPPELWLVCARALRAAGLAQQAQAAAERGAQWVEAAASNLEPALRDAFVARQPVNVALRALAAGRTDQPALAR